MANFKRQKAKGKCETTNYLPFDLSFVGAGAHRGVGGVKGSLQRRLPLLGNSAALVLKWRRAPGALKGRWCLGPSGRHMRHSCSGLLIARRTHGQSQTD